MKQRRIRSGKALAAGILGYLKQHPNAKDTVRGIVEWWLLEQCIRQTLADVRKALRTLVDRGLILECKQSGNDIYYSLNRNRKAGTRQLRKSESCPVTSKQRP